MTFFIVTKDNDLCFGANCFEPEWEARSFISDNIDLARDDEEEQRARFRLYRCESTEELNVS